ncbi:NAD(P)/FAD-dependent oxidoreductase [Paenibacillus oenotherae]|uniref:NAD(P)/FAD-dependent oxidoreductase n=1 Tax=Paenibacillus oenotherae TaxID=1435645 RepID=A0ABS7DAD1_9BACL|nr:NAD(P)/FAD-dependent oxidoreductase [Paenibacillus oenotherae]
MERTTTDYDVIIVGARVAGSSLAYECSKAGLSVLLLDKGSFPSDILSTHNFFNNSLAMLREMGVLDRLLGTGTPTYRRAHIQFDESIIDGEYPEATGEKDCLCIRRTHLDHILFQHACEQEGVTGIEGFRVTDVIMEGDAVAGVVGCFRDGRTERFTARLVVGADGRHSAIRSLVGSEQKMCVPTDYASYVAYVADYRQEGERCVEFYKIGENLAIIFPTSDDLFVVGVMFPLDNHQWRNRFTIDPETALRSFVDIHFATTRSSFPQRLQQSRVALPIRGLLGYDNDWHQGMGKGWALLGDALSFKDPAVGQGLHDAIYGSRVLTRILSATPHWESGWEEMAGSYEQEMESKMMARFQMACQFTKNVPTTEEQSAVNRLIGSSGEATAAFLGLYNYSKEPEDLEAVISRLMQGQI